MGFARNYGRQNHQSDFRRHQEVFFAFLSKITLKSHEL
ncbi:hypothetical protein LRU_00932 [Ligilactobacillus ruminis SPM0211]|uniref:Uncharacterized protein n=1 Tax=Ligilactobacillus ruminis SPM0211 TaxID=1040964 RepID=F7QZS8_9LACO|nr:hypothetical protein LRU_00932 [Ligilactobacillus ruminis SPM0211]